MSDINITGGEKRTTNNLGVIKTSRLRSIDTLRGFDMFWIMGADSLIRIMAENSQSSFWKALAAQMEHPYWNGFTFYDLIFPLFMFLSGISSPFSIDTQLRKGITKNQVLFKVVKRGLILILLGMIYNNGGLLLKPLEDVRFPSVLGKIGAAYMFANIIYLYASRQGRVIWFWALLIGYWLMLSFTSAPGYPPGDLSEKGNFMSYFDRTFLPGKLSRGIHDTSGFLCTITGVATTLLGVIAGSYLKSSKLPPARKAYWFAVAGASLIILSFLWGWYFPINKNLWSSPFVLLTGGLSLLLFSLFYYVIDVKAVNKWTFFFSVIGMNSIFIYLSPKFIHYSYAAGGLTAWFSGLFGNYQNAVHLIFTIAVQWLVLYIMYKRKIFLKV